LPEYHYLFSLITRQSNISWKNGSLYNSVFGSFIDVSGLNCSGNLSKLSNYLPLFHHSQISNISSTRRTYLTKHIIVIILLVLLIMVLILIMLLLLFLLVLLLLLIVLLILVMLVFLMLLIVPVVSSTVVVATLQILCSKKHVSRCSCLLRSPRRSWIQTWSVWFICCVICFHLTDCD